MMSAGIDPVGRGPFGVIIVVVSGKRVQVPETQKGASSRSVDREEAPVAQVAKVRGNRLCAPRMHVVLGSCQIRGTVREMIRPALHGFRDDARTAIQAAPDYFVWWYTTKSIGLCVAVAALTFMLGRASKKDCR